MVDVPPNQCEKPHEPPTTETLLDSCGNAHTVVVDKRRVPPQTEILYDSHGNPHTVVIGTGPTRKIWVQPQYELRRVRVHVVDRYETREVSAWVPGYWHHGAGRRRHRSGLGLGAIFKF